jgi:hypothetical protein
MNEYSLEEILPLLSERIKKYTSNESTSVANSTAKVILSSILYCLDEDTIDEESHLNAIRVSEKLSVFDAYYNGLNRKKEKVKKAKALYNQILEEFYYVNNRCYLDTILKGFPVFFERYDIEFNAEYHILTLDYPLFHEVIGLTGIDLIYGYLQCVYIEQDFLQIFSNRTIHEILMGYDEGYEELIFNVSKIIYRISIVCFLLNKNIYELDLGDGDRLRLNDLVIQNKTQVELEQILINASKEMLRELGIEDGIIIQYFQTDLSSFAFELITLSKKTQLEQILPSRVQGRVNKKIIYEDGELMEDEELRNLIEEMKDCRFISDKLILLKERVHSLSDLVEVLQEAFFDKEYDEVFRLLSEQELKVLKGEVEQKMKFEEELKDWEFALFRF